MGVTGGHTWKEALGNNARRIRLLRSFSGRCCKLERQARMHRTPFLRTERQRLLKQGDQSERVRKATPTAGTPQWFQRLARGLTWAFGYIASFALFAWLAWEVGWVTSISDTDLEAKDFVGGTIAFSVSVACGSAVVALTKPFLRSWWRCIPVAFVALLVPSITIDRLSMSALSSTEGFQIHSLVDGIKFAALLAPLAGWALWQFAKQGPAWKWPFRS